MEITLHAPHGRKPLIHEWGPDFSKGEPARDSKICGVCGRTDDLYHFRQKRALRVSVSSEGSGK